jgi:hypothetical protein
MVEFDIQTFLRDMRVEVSTGFASITERAEKIADALATHEKTDLVVQAALSGRLASVESMAANMKWFTRVGIGAFVVFVADLILHHYGAK